MATAHRYDSIGHTYSQHRFTDPTWAAEIDRALGGATRVLNVGAGTGNYEDFGRELVALEPSRVMIDQRSSTAAPVVQGVSEALPFADDSFDAVMGVLTMHHWSDRTAGLHETGRVARHQVFTVYEPEPTHKFWLFDYFPEAARSSLELNAPTPTTIDEILEVTAVSVLWVSRDCDEGFAAASWAEPEQYLDPSRQAAISLLALAPPEVRHRGTERLRGDIESGAWHQRYAHLAQLDRADFGYRLVVARSRRAT